jgi:hypothetical protein
MQFAFIAQIIDGTPEDRFVPHLKAEAQKAIDFLPFVQMGVLKVDIIPLAPYVGYERLFSK